MNNKIPAENERYRVEYITPNNNDTTIDHIEAPNFATAIDTIKQIVGNGSLVSINRVSPTISIDDDKLREYLMNNETIAETIAEGDTDRYCVYDDDFCYAVQNVVEALSSLDQIPYEIGIDLCTGADIVGIQYIAVYVRDEKSLTFRSTTYSADKLTNDANASGIDGAVAIAKALIEHINTLL